MKYSKQLHLRFRKKRWGWYCTLDNDAKRFLGVTNFESLCKLAPESQKKIGEYEVE